LVPVPGAERKNCLSGRDVATAKSPHGSHIPLTAWLITILLICSSKEGLSAHQIHAMLGITNRSARFMVHRLRDASTQDGMAAQLTGFVEVD
jgi:hypothetical protein